MDTVHKTMTKLDHNHTPEAITEHLDTPPNQSYLRDWVLGGIDGAITTFAIVSGVAGAGLAHKVIIILGIANLIADGISMAASNYSGVKAENDEYWHLRQKEKNDINLSPQRKQEELRQIFAHKGFKGDDLERAVTVISSNEDQWIDFMMTEEFGASKNRRSPYQAAIATFLAFAICGAIPLLPFALSLPHSFTIATIATCAVFFTIGALKSKWSTAKWWLSGLETLVIGTIAAGTAYFIGDLLEKIVT